ncbi:protein FAM185A-like isoform X2 [Patiria miniata]|uniref:DUF4097 domain-containing protein n=1 Tax=Patiria miniata TaxID=46514 RepID=A0A914AC64_PATMI|nr:protein FAM185A-like isoform X2 [Patiria miniata]
MFRLVCPSLQPLFIREIHRVAFSKRFLLQNKMMLATACAYFHWPDTHSHSASGVGLTMQSYHGYKRLRTQTTPCCSMIRLASTSNPENPTRSVEQDSQPTDKSAPNFHLVKLRSWAFAVEPFGSLSFKTSLSIRVMPIDPHDYPAADRAFVHLLLCSKSRDEKVKQKIESFGKGSDRNGMLERFVRCSVQYSDDVIHINGDAVDDVNDTLISKEDTDYLWLVEVPMSYDVKAVTTDEASVTVEHLENQTCKVQTDKGDIVTKKLKSDKVSLRSTSGDVNCMKMLQGNITIATGDYGNVTTDRLQGQEVSINAGSGAILVKDVYANNSSFGSVNGGINLGNLHGDVAVSCKEGNLNIGSLDGSLTAHIDKGDITVYLAKHKDVDIDCKQVTTAISIAPPA